MKNKPLVPGRAEGLSPYSGQRVALLTKHGKERVIAPVLEPTLGCRIVLVDGFDTDQLGTFTRDIPRYGTQLEAARKKARIGMELSGLQCGLASEGSFGADPYTGMFPWNIELLIFIDDNIELEIVGVSEDWAVHGHLSSTSWSEAETFAQQVKFPGHQLVLRPEGKADRGIKKDIASWEQYRLAYEQASNQAFNGRVLIENDLRAYANPTRLENIRRAADNLQSRLQSLCPACGTPGFWLIEQVPGLPCADCGMLTLEIRTEIQGCLKCDYRVNSEGVDQQYADPGRCNVCNP